jgi:hypothetical protein
MKSKCPKCGSVGYDPILLRCGACKVVANGPLASYAWRHFWANRIVAQLLGGARIGHAAPPSAKTLDPITGYPSATDRYVAKLEAQDRADMERIIAETDRYFGE